MQLRLASSTVQIRPISTTVMCGLVLCLLGLAYWQWQRALEKHQIAIQTQTQHTQTLSYWQQQPPTHLRGVKIRTRVQHWQAEYWWLDNQVVAGRVGFNLLRIAQTDIGPVVVNCGFIAAPGVRSAGVPDMPELPAGEYAVWLQPIPETAQLLLATQHEFPRLIAEITQRDLTHLPANNRYFMLTFAESVPPLVSHYQPYVITAEKHQGYALQWLLLAIAAVVVWLFASVKQDPL